jgi:hypothetical protein
MLTSVEIGVAIVRTLTEKRTTDRLIGDMQHPSSPAVPRVKIWAYFWELAIYEKYGFKGKNREISWADTYLFFKDYC